MKVTHILKFVIKDTLKSGRSRISLVGQPFHSAAARFNQSSISVQFQKWREIFCSSDIPDPEESIKHILSAVTGIPHHEVCRRNEDLAEGQLEQLESLCQCRLARMPVQYIVKNWDFLDLTLSMHPPVFIPRPETETLALLVEDELKNLSNAKILEVGSGSGAISCALLKRNTTLAAVAIDQSSLACNLTRSNAKRYGLETRLEVLNAKLTDKGIERIDGDVLDFSETFDLIVSNPPYIPQFDVRRLQPEILLYEDIRALDGGRDGLATISNILLHAPKWLKTGGKIFLETDHRHPDLLRKIFSGSDPANGQYKLELIKVHPDLFGKERFVEFRKNIGNV